MAVPLYIVATCSPVSRAHVNAASVCARAASVPSPSASSCGLGTRAPPDAIDRIHRAIREGAERFMRDGAYEVAWPAVLAAARKPHS